MSRSCGLAGLEKRYSEEGPAALAGVTFDVVQGELLVIVGQSGGGKTTLLRLLCGLMRPTAGTVHLDGHRVSSPPREAAIVFQDYSRSLFPWLNVTRNVMFPLRGEREPASEKTGASRVCSVKWGWKAWVRNTPGSSPVACSSAWRSAREHSSHVRGDPAARRAVRASSRNTTRAELQDLVLRLHQHEEKGVTRSSTSRTTSTRRSIWPTACSCSAAPPGAWARRSTYPCRDLASRRRLAARRSSFRFATSSTPSSPRASRYNPAFWNTPGTHRWPLWRCAVRAVRGRCRRRRADEDQGRVPGGRACRLRDVREAPGHVHKARHQRGDGAGTNPPLLTAALLSGDVQFSGTHAGNAALFKSRGFPVKVVASGALYEPKNPTSALVAPRGSSIKGPRGPRRQDDPDRRRPTRIAHIGLLKWLKRRSFLQGRREDQLRRISGHGRLAVQGRRGC